MKLCFEALKLYMLGDNDLPKGTTLDNSATVRGQRDSWHLFILFLSMGWNKENKKILSKQQMEPLSVL